jgi:hypothetical protein
MPDRNKQTNKKEKTNQYINETELKSLMIRINNKTFLDFLSTSFNRLNKYISKYKTTSNLEFKKILEKYIIDVSWRILKSKKHQLLLLSDIVVKEYRTIIEQRNIEEVLRIMEPLNEEMLLKNTILKDFKNSDSIRINKYISKHTKSKSQKFKRLLREHIVLISERNIIDNKSYERFGEMILLIIRNILKKPKFSGYTYRDEFYSDSTDKILRYLKNFKHKMISKITGNEVNAFSYLSQYVHNSILFIINSKNAEKAEVEKYVNTYNENITLIYNESSYTSNDKEIEINIDLINKDLYNTILNKAEEFNSFNIIKIIYPAEYRINLYEYSKLKELNNLLNKTIQITRNKG